MEGKGGGEGVLVAKECGAKSGRSFSYTEMNYQSVQHLGGLLQF